MCGYLRKRPDAAIRFRTDIPTKIHIAPTEQDWYYSVYGQVTEENPEDMPPAHGKRIRTT
jgi:hypothetical protein